MQIKENAVIMAEFYDKLCAKFDFALKYGLKKAIIGYFLSGKFFVPNLQIWVLPKNKNDFITHNSFEKRNPVKLTDDLQEICEELRAYCKKHGDDWQRFTFVMEKKTEKIHYKAAYSYEAINLIDSKFLLAWKGNYFYN
ncbi:MAG: hypothetical protein FWH48_00170 [Oscillospiraceae bacterium]|nr:hypothetical protein [Oscillospiraceae bacterium]